MKSTRYKKKEDELILSRIKYFLKERPSYGHKRITTMINNEKILDFKINRKRVYRIMSINDLLLRKSAPRRDSKEHTGKIITLHSNTRWCSDTCEIKCFNGEKVYVGFILDCCDRELIAYVAKKEPILKNDIQEMQLEAVSQRCHEIPLGRKIQFLSDRGAIYRSPDTINFARSIGIQSCFTMPYSPESNGMSEAFVNTLKRDYVYCNDCVDAKTVIKMIPHWIKDYNEVAPHSGLGMMSPLMYKNLNINNMAV